MKKFAIISVVLILLAAGAFGYSLYHYLDVTGVLKTIGQTATPDQVATEEPTLNMDSAGDSSEDGIFSAYAKTAEEYVKGLSREQMVGQLILGVCPDLDTAKTDIESYHLGGYWFSEDNFYYLSKDEIKSELAAVSSGSSVSPILAAREEGGYYTTVSNLDAFSDETYDSPRNLYESSSMDAVRSAEDKKAALLSSLGFNLNLAPVVDMPEEYDQIMYSRSLSSDVEIVSAYAEYVTKAMQDKGVSVALKHFPGYGTIHDTTESIVVDTRDAKEIMDKDIKPFKAGADAGAHFVMVSNVVVQNMDKNHTAALSSTIHSVLREEVGFSGVIITDRIDDEDYSGYADGHKVAVQAMLAGNDMIIAGDYKTAYEDILSALTDGTLSEQLISEKCQRVIAYKYANGILQ